VHQPAQGRHARAARARAWWLGWDTQDLQILVRGDERLQAGQSPSIDPATNKQDQRQAVWN
jgi:hypothetical protein